MKEKLTAIAILTIQYCLENYFPLLYSNNTGDKNENGINLFFGHNFLMKYQLLNQVFRKSIVKAETLFRNIKVRICSE